MASKEVRKFLAEIGAKGGKIGGAAGTGDAKRRPPEHYAMLAERRREVAARRKK